MRSKLIPLFLALPQALMTAAGLAGAYTLLRLFMSDRENSGMLIGLVSVSVWTLVGLIATGGIWKRRNWARWLAVVINMPIALLILSEWLFEGDVLDMDDSMVMAGFFAVGLFYALPFTGRRLRRSSPE